MSSNLPPGVSENDPMAPWNQPEFDLVKCPDCYGTGEEPDHTNHDCSPIICKTCKGMGEIEGEEPDGDELADARREPDWPK